jgi:hypothetical protein
MLDDTAEHIFWSKLSFNLLSRLVNHLSLYYSVLPLNELLFIVPSVCMYVYSFGAFLKKICKNEPDIFLMYLCLSVRT